MSGLKKDAQAVGVEVATIVVVHALIVGLVRYLRRKEDRGVS